MAITSATSQQTVNATTSTITLPASVAAGDMLIAIVGMDVGASTSTNDGGFTELKDETGTDVWAWIAYKIAAGGESSFVLTHTSERSNAIAYRIPAGEWHGTTVPEITAVGDGTSTTPDPPSLTPSWGATGTTTYIAIQITDDSAVPFPVTAWPTNYSLNQVQHGNNSSTGAASSAAAVAACIRLLSGSPENPGTFTNTVSEHWRTYTIGVRGSAGTTVVPGSGTLTLTGQVPVIASKVVPTNGALVLTGQVPVVSVASVVVPGSGTLTLTGQVPVLTFITRVVPTNGTLVLTGQVPVITTINRLVPTAGSLTLTGQVPVLVLVDRRVPTAGTLVLTGQVPVVTTAAAAVELAIQWADETTDYVDYIKRNTLVIKTNTDRRNGTMTVTLIGPAADLYGAGKIAVAQADVWIQFNAYATTLFDGIVRQVTPKDLANGQMEVALGCQDFTSLYGDYVVTGSGVRTTVETDIARMQWLVDTFMAGYPGGAVGVSGTSVVAAMPSQDFSGMTMAEAFAEVCKVTGADWYPEVGSRGGTVIYTSVGVVRALTTPYGVAATDTLTSTAHGLAAGKRIQFTQLTGGTGLTTLTPYYVIAGGLTADAFKVSLTSGGSAVNFTTDLTLGSWELLQDAAPFGFSDTPDDATTFGYSDLTIAEDSTERKDALYVVGGEGYSETFTRPSGYLDYDSDDLGERTGIIKDTKLTTHALGLAASEAYFADRGNARQTGQLTTWTTGILPGMDIAVTSVNQLKGLHDSSLGVHASSPQTFRVSTITTKYPRQGQLSYTLSFGSVPKELQHAIYDIAGQSQSRTESIIAGVLRGYVGEIIGWPIATPPVGFLICNGASLLRTAYADLFAVIGTTFGSADGTHFTLPNGTDRFLLGVGTKALAATGGALGHTHTEAAHTHTGPSHTHSHSHAGPSHTHTGPSHTHTSASHQHELPFIKSSSTGLRVLSETVFGTGTSRTPASVASISADTSSAAVMMSEDMAPGSTGSGGTGNTGSGGTGTTDTDATAGGTGNTGSSGGAGTGASDPPYLAIYFAIRYA